MATATFAISAEARFGLHELADQLRAFRDPDALRLPEREGVDRSCGPGAARRAVAVTHGFRRALYLDFHGATKAIASMPDHFPRSPFSRRRRVHALFSPVPALNGMIVRSCFLIRLPAFGLLL